MEPSFKDRMILQNGKMFLKLTSRNIFGDSTYAFVVTDKHEFDRMCADQQQKSYVSYSDYGDMIMFGKGEPDNTQEEMAIAIAMKKYAA